jgi:hypothetical protein
MTDALSFHSLANSIDSPEGVRSAGVAEEVRRGGERTIDAWNHCFVTSAADLKTSTAEQGHTFLAVNKHMPLLQITIPLPVHPSV